MVSDLLSTPQAEMIQVSLNPCSNGIWSLTDQHGSTWIIGCNVLILVLMEYGL